MGEDSYELIGEIVPAAIMSGFLVIYWKLGLGSQIDFHLRLTLIFLFMSLICLVICSVYCSVTGIDEDRQSFFHQAFSFLSELFEKLALAIDITRFEIYLRVKKPNAMIEEVERRVYRFLALASSLMAVLLLTSAYLEYYNSLERDEDNLLAIIAEVAIMVFVDFGILLWYVTILIRMRNQDKH